MVAGTIFIFVLRQFSRPLKPTEKASPTTVITSSEPLAATSADDADCPTSSGQVVGSQSAQTGQRPEPYTHTSWLIRSRDGVNFTVEQKLLDHASVPEIITLPDGRLAVYAVDFTEATGQNQEQLVLITSSDEGQTWTDPTPICLSGKTTTGAAVDPSAVTLPDGRVRLYYFGFGPPAGTNNQPDPSASHKFYSAISEDGRKFTEEAGLRFQGQTITDPEVVQLPNGTWLMYISAGQETLIVSSGDGLAFTDTGTTVSSGGVPGAVVLADGSIRWYGCGQSGIVTATATDGVNFRPTETVNFSPKPTDPMICDPAVIRLPDGTFVGVIKTAPGQARGSSGQPAGQTR